jgi:hypothetical protein
MVLGAMHNPPALLPFEISECFVECCIAQSARHSALALVGRVYLPALVCWRKAGYGVGSCGDESATEGDREFDDGMIRLGALPEGVKKGVLSDDEAADRVLSLLRARFDDEGDAGTANGAEDMSSVPVKRPALGMTLRRRARNLCSLKVTGAFLCLGT